MPKRELDYKKDTAIDPDCLDEENFRQPSLYQDYADHASGCELKVKRLQERKKTIRSQQIKACKRVNPKVTGAEMEAHYRTSEEYIAVVDELINAEYDLSMAMNAVFAMGQKRHSLERANELYLGKYFAPVREPRHIQPGKRISSINHEERVATQRVKLKEKKEERETTPRRSRS